MGEKKIFDNGVSVELSSRSEWGSSGGIGYYSQVHVYYNDQHKMQEWQWRDRYSASNDRPWLSVQDIGEVKVSEEGGRIIVKVELVNSQHGNRIATYAFDKAKENDPHHFSNQEQTALVEAAEQEVQRILAELNKLHGRKSQMLGAHGYISYTPSSLKQKFFRPEIGVAAFVTEEQIDHRGSDRQMRYELFVLTSSKKKAERKAEDHGYDRREGGAFLTIVEVETDHITINTKSGKSVIKI